MARKIGIISGKGGVGKTTLSINLGLAMQNLGEEVMVVDANMRNPNVGIYLGLFDFPTTLHTVLEKKINPLQALYTHNSGVKIVPSSISLEALNVETSGLKNSFKNLGGTVIMDSAPGLGKDVISVVEACDELIVVTNPELPAVSEALKTIQFVNTFDKKVIGIVVNKVKNKKYEVKKDEIEWICDTPVIGVIPDDENVRKSFTKKNPVVFQKPFSPSSIAFYEIAAHVMGQDYKKPNLLFLRRMLDR